MFQKQWQWIFTTVALRYVILAQLLCGHIRHNGSSISLTSAHRNDRIFRGQVYEMRCNAFEMKVYLFETECKEQNEENIFTFTFSFSHNIYTWFSLFFWILVQMLEFRKFLYMCFLSTSLTTNKYIYFLHAANKCLEKVR